MHAHSHVCDVRAKMLSNSMSAVCAALFRVYISDLSVHIRYVVKKLGYSNEYITKYV